MSRTIIESEAMRVSLVPDYGARVTGLLDKHSGREWLQQGSASDNNGERAQYLGDEAIGWDECFPTVSPCDANSTAWRRRLRDHGDLWGRRWFVDEATSTSVTTCYIDPAYRFTRTLSVSGSVLTARYSLLNRSDETLPYLWALHGLLLATDADRIVVPGIDRVTATYLGLNGKSLESNSQPWPKGDGVLPFALDEVQKPSRNFAGKLYAHGAKRCALGHVGAWLEIAWDGIDDLGLWYNYGAWPSAPGGYHVALEPTTASADDLNAALAAGTAAQLLPGTTNTWTVTLTFREDLK
ncbi:MAG: hypothetical protein ABL879_18835 [Devosia sp.]